MKSMKLHKMFGLALAAASICVLFAFPAFSGSWQLNSRNGWQYVKDNGDYARNGWELVNGKYYYFNSDSYMLSGEITPDGYVVGLDGAWMPDQTPDKLSDGTYYPIADTEISSYWVSDTDYRVSEKNRTDIFQYLTLYISNGTNTASSYDTHDYLLDNGTGTIRNTGTGLYVAENALDSDYTDFWVERISASQDYIFVKAGGEGDGGWDDTIMYKK